MIKQPPEGELILYMIHCPDCPASRMTERAMRMWKYHYPEVKIRFLGRKRLGVEEIMDNYLFLNENGMKVKSLPTFFIGWSKRPRLVLWWTTGGVDSSKQMQVEDLYRDIEKGFEIARKKVIKMLKKGG